MPTVEKSVSSSTSASPDRVAIILSIDAERERVSLGLKQIKESAFLDYIENLETESDIECLITSVSEEGIILLIDNKIDGVLKLTQKDLKECLEKETYKKDDKAKFKIKSFDKKNHQIVLTQN